MPVLDASGAISQTIASVGISSQLDAALARDMEQAACLVGAPRGG